MKAQIVDRGAQAGSVQRSMLHGAWGTAVTLFGGLTVGLLAGSVAFELIPGSSVENVRVGHAATAAIPALSGLLAGGAAWGIQLGRLAGGGERRRLALAGMLGFGPITILLGAILGLAEPEIVAAFAGGLPIHRIFTLLFVPAAVLIAGTSAWALGRALRLGPRARRLFWQVGLAAGAAFLVVNITTEALGWIVGAPGAVERATMLTVMSLGNLGAALVGGAWLGRWLWQWRSQAPPAT